MVSNPHMSWLCCPWTGMVDAYHYSGPSPDCSGCPLSSVLMVLSFPHTWACLRRHRMLSPPFQAFSVFWVSFSLQEYPHAFLISRFAMLKNLSRGHRVSTVSIPLIDTNGGGSRYTLEFPAKWQLDPGVGLERGSLFLSSPYRCGLFSQGGRRILSPLSVRCMSLSPYDALIPWCTEEI